MKTAVALLAASFVLVLPGSAMAARVSLDLQQSDLGPGEMLENLHYTAAAGETNRVSISFNGSGTYTVVDRVAITPGRNCTATDSTHVTCVQTSGERLGGVQVKLGDRNDRASLSGHGGVVLGGAGTDVLKGSEFQDTLSAGSSSIRLTKSRTKDRLSGRNGDDRLLGSRGANRIDGGQGHDTISAGRGNDIIKARDSRVDQVRCGGGLDRARLDTADFLADRCHSVSRPGTPAATPVDLFTSGFNANVIVGCPRDVIVDRCKGSVSITRGKRSFGRKRFNLRPGKQVTKSFRLPSDIRNAIGPNGGPRVKVTVRSVSGLDGRRTIFFVRRALPPPGD